MLTNQIAKSFYSRFAGSEPGFTARNIGLAAKCALMVYRKCGKSEAQAFITGIRLIMTYDASELSLSE